MARNSVQVCIKARPLLAKEGECESCWKIVNNSIQLLDSQSEPFYFDHIFNQDESNEVIFEKMAKPIVHSAMEGFNGTIFAYGQTSSGKTYTMMGDETNPGVMVRAAKEIFHVIDQEKMEERVFLLRIGYIEIYNEKIYDLFKRSNQDLKIHETTGMVNINCEEKIVTCEADLLDYLAIGSKERTVGETNMNERSSRSHAIFRIIIESRKMNDETVTLSVLNLVDLAGSERADQTGARGARLKEGAHINKSLLFLSRVIKQLSENEEVKYISYRDSKLTRILQASLGGNTLTAIICMIKSSAVEETQSTLNFAMRAKCIKNKPKVNEIVSDATMMRRLEGEVRELKARLAEELLRNASQLRVGQLEHRIHSEQLKFVSSSSLHNQRNQRDNRRRTWCATVATDAALLLQSSATSSAVAPPSGLLKFGAHFTPHITMRTDSADDPVPAFEPDELPSSEAPATPQRQNCHRTESLTPVGMINSKVKLEIAENALLELTELTNLERQLGVKHDVYGALKQQVDVLTQRNASLEQERIQSRTDLELTRHELRTEQQRGNELQQQLSDWTASCTANEAQLAELKQITERLQLENREAVAIEFELERQRNRARQRETELLDALGEKDGQLTKLEKTLHSLREERRQQLSGGGGGVEAPLRSSDDAGGDCAACAERSKEAAAGNKLEANDAAAAVAAMQTEFAALQNRYDALQAEHEQLGERSQADCARLQCVNQALQRELEALREHAERVQSELVENAATVERSQVSLRELQTQHDAVQHEYEDLSNQLMDNVQEGETLRRQRDEAEGRLRRSEDDKAALEAANQRLREELSEAQRAATTTTISHSLRSSGVGMDDSQGEVETAVAPTGPTDTHVATSVPALGDDNAQVMAELRRRVSELSARNESLCAERQTLVESTERTITEMRDQVARLSAELFEKSSFLERCACGDPQQRQQLDTSAPADGADLTLDSMADSKERRKHAEANQTLCVPTTLCRTIDDEGRQELIAELRASVQRMEAELDESRAQLRLAKEQNSSNAALHKREEERLQLELLAKLELSESEYREHMRNYNREWQQGRADYERELAALQSGAAQTEQRLVAKSAETDELRAALATMEREQAALNAAKAQLADQLNAEQALLSSAQAQLQAEIDCRARESEQSANTAARLAAENEQLAAQNAVCVDKEGVLAEALSAVTTQRDGLQVELRQLLATLEANREMAAADAAEQQALRERVDALEQNLQLARDALQQASERCQEERESCAERERSLQQKVDALILDLDTAQAQASACDQLRDECAALRQQLADTAAAQCQVLATAEQKATAAKERLQAAQQQLQRQCQDAHSQLDEMTYKCDSLQRGNVDLERRLTTAAAAKAELLQRCETACEEQRQLRAQCDMQTAERQQLEEASAAQAARILALEATAKRYESELAKAQQQRRSDSANTSAEESCGSTSPRSTRRSVERVFGESLCLKSANPAIYEDKVSTIQQKMSQIDSTDRRRRRLSTHDERRCNSTYWGASRDVMTMTEPTDGSCNCAALDAKLRDSEKRLFISDSQVNTLKLQLKNHPLRVENTALIKRVQDEQAKQRHDAAAYKQQIAELKARATSASAAKTKAIRLSAETQTVSEWEEGLHKLQSKYNDLKKICRSRYTMIRDLEERIAQKENVDSNASSATPTATK